jgi:dipeptidyl aminopeptidase/acylaminoacyl peptidase
LIAITSYRTWAQAPNPLLVSDALNERSFGGFGFHAIDLSPDGRWVAYVVASNEKTNSQDQDAWSRSGVPLGRTGDDIWISDTQTRESKNLTSGKDENWLPTWSPDGSLLAFISDRDGSGQAKLWIWDRKTDRLKKVSDAAVRTQQLQWLPDGHRLLLTAMPEGLSVDDYAGRTQANAAAQTPAVGKFDGATVWLYRSGLAAPEIGPVINSDPWSLKAFVHDLASIDLATGAVRYVVRGQRIARFSVSPDGAHIVYTNPTRFEKPGSQQMLYDLTIVTLATNQEQVIATDISLGVDGGGFSWSPDSKLVGYHTSGMEKAAKDCYIVAVAEGRPRNVTNFLFQTETTRLSSAPLWDAGGELYLVQKEALWRVPAGAEKAIKVAEIPGHRILDMISRGENLLWTTNAGRFAIAVVHDDASKQDGFYRIDLGSGASESLLEKGQCYTCIDFLVPWAVSEDGVRLAFIAEDAQHDSDLWLADAAFHHPQRVTNLNPQYDKYSMGRVQLVDWLSEDGERLHGALLLPSGYEPTKRYPLVVWVYGGSMLSDHYDHFGLLSDGPFNMQLLATRGYAVLLPDSPQHEATPLADLAKTVLPGVNKVIEIGVADPDRLGVFGQSNGGYSTLGLIVQTKRFKAAVDLDGMGDLVGHYGQMSTDGASFGISLEHGQDAMGGTVWALRQRYIENSPFFYLDRVETPVLIVHGAKDSVVAPFLGDEVFVGLRRLGKEAVYAKYANEEHSPLYWSYQNQTDLCNRVLAWFDKYLRQSP